MLIKHLFLIPTSEQTSLSSFPQRQAFSLFQTWGFPLNSTAREGAIRGFSPAFLAPSANRKRRQGTMPVSLTQKSVALFSSSCSDPFPEPCSDSSYGNGRQSLWRSHRGKGRHGSTHPAWSDEGCAQHRQESSAWKVQLKEETPALCKRARSSTASFGLSEQQRQQRNHSLGYGTACLETALCERGEICLQIC